MKELSVHKLDTGENEGVSQERNPNEQKTGCVILGGVGVKSRTELRNL